MTVIERLKELGYRRNSRRELDYNEAKGKLKLEFSNYQEMCRNIAEYLGL